MSFLDVKGVETSPQGVLVRGDLKETQPENESCACAARKNRQRRRHRQRALCSGPGPEAIAEGFRYLGHKDDHALNAAGWIVYDALYAYCQEMVGKPNGDFAKLGITKDGYLLSLRNAWSASATSMGYSSCTASLPAVISRD